MIDYVKLEINSYSVAENIKKNIQLDFNTDVNNATGEEQRQIAKYKGMKIYVHPNNKIIFEGSLHKYFNSGEHNYNDFSFKNLIETINNLCQTFNFRASEAYLRGFEFGVNISTSIDPNQFLDMIVCYGNASVNKMNIPGAKGIYCTKTNDKVKVYNKSIQYGQKVNILRIEDKIIRMRKIKDLNIFSLHDLTKIENINELGLMLNEMFQNLIIHEPINSNNLTTAEQRFYEQCGNPRHWTALNPKQRYKKLKRYNLLIEENSIYKIKETIAVQIVEKWNYLVNKGNEYTSIKIDQFSDKYTGSIACIHNPKVNESNNLNERICLACGRDISNQKIGSKFCSEKLFGKGVKQCRNKVSNPKNNLKKKVKNSIKKYNKSSIPLFAVERVYKHLM